MRLAVCVASPFWTSSVSVTDFRFFFFFVNLLGLRSTVPVAPGV
jgi:hypothetical protein